MKFDGIRLAIAPIGWSNDDMPLLGGHISFEQCIQEMAEAGYEGCEVGHKFPRNPEQLQAALLPHQLSVASAWYSLYFTEPGRKQETIEGFINHMNFLSAMGAKVIVVCECGHSIQGKALSLFEHKPIFSEIEWQFLISGLDEITELAKEKEMQIVYHHHMGTGIQQANEIDRLMIEANKRLSLLFDTGHLTYAGETPLSVLKKHGHRIKHVHLKDIRKQVLERVKKERMNFLDSVKAGVFTVPGDGCIDFNPLFELFSELNYQGWWVVEAEQDPALANPLVYASKARDFLRLTTGL